MLEEFAIPKHGGRTGLQEINLNQGDAAGKDSRAGQAAAATAAAIMGVRLSCCTPADILDDLSDHDALFIAEDDNYERCEGLARCACWCC
jgi:hypothetical protein